MTDRMASHPHTTDRMADVDHTHPHTGETFGEAFRRGPDVAADGGSRDAADEADDAGAEEADGRNHEETMKDVDHEPPSAGVTRAFERGTEGRDETV